MKQGLVKHITDIFQTLQINESFEVIACGTELLPDWTNAISISNEFIVICEKSFELTKLRSFLGKEIYTHDKYIYWFEGESIAQITFADSSSSSIMLQENTKYLKTETRLPAYLDDYIFNELSAEYAPDYQKFDFNLNLTEEDNLKYLGTYFPRSYGESFCIFDNIFQNDKYLQILSKKNTLNILSIGCGTGGDLIGLLTVIDKYCPNLTELNIWAVDGNADALSIMGKIVTHYSKHVRKAHRLHIVHSTLNSIAEINLSQLTMQKYDFVLSFKFVCEIISNGNGNYDNSYYEFCRKFLPMLTDTGFCLLLDVTTKSQHTNYNPILMNRQLNHALRELKVFKTLLPVSCSLYANECELDCFTQKTFTISHLKRNQDKSKVAYRIIGYNDFVDLIGSFDNSSRYLIHDTRSCPMTAHLNGIVQDAYLLEDTNSEYKLEIAEEPTLVSTQPIIPEKDYPREVDEIIPEKLLTGLKILGRIDVTQFEKPKKEIHTNKQNYYIIDTNVFVDFPSILDTIAEPHEIVLSAKVIDELDGLKLSLDDLGKQNVRNALKSINNNMDKRKIIMDIADVNLLPIDFNKKSADNLILSVALKYINVDPILLTSDNGLQVKAKGMKIKTVTLKNHLKQNSRW